MACCLTAPSHYLNQCWLITRGVLWHTSESSFAGIAQGIDSGYEFEKDILKNIFKSPRGQWVKLMVTKLTDVLHLHYGPISATEHHKFQWCYTLNIYCQAHLKLNSLWPSDAIWQQETGSTLAQVMACCLTALNHYLKKKNLKKKDLVSQSYHNSANFLVIFRATLPTSGTSPSWRHNKCHHDATMRHQGEAWQRFCTLDFQASFVVL